MSEIKIKPLSNRVVIKPIPVEEKTAGGIIIPETAKERPVRGEVVAIGEGKHDQGAVIPMVVKLGDTVIYSKYSGTEITVEDKDYLIMSEDDIIAIV